jgi:hypothetical protein
MPKEREMKKKKITHVSLQWDRAGSSNSTN